jgi:hypothetical protein
MGRIALAARLVVTASVVAAGCSSQSSTWVCSPGTAVVCSCPQGGKGAALCSDDGLSIGACLGCGGADLGTNDLAVGMDLGADLAMRDQSASTDDLATTGDQSAAGDQSMLPVDAAMSIDLSNALDMSVPPDLTMVSDLTANGIVCGNATCPVGVPCCVSTSFMMTVDGGGPVTVLTCNPGGCPDGSIADTCDGPEDCAGNPCCLQVMNAISPPMCTMAANACVPQLNGMVTAGQTRACHSNSDCTAGAMNTALNLCCTVVPSGLPKMHLCLNQVIVGAVGGSCP